MMNEVLTEILPILPVILPLTGAMVAWFLRRWQRSQGWFSLGVMGLSLLSSVLLLATVWQAETPLVYLAGDWPVPYGIVLVADLLAQLPGSQITLPLNAVTALIGAPVVTWVILRQRNLRSSFAG